MSEPRCVLMIDDDHHLPRLIGLGLTPFSNLVLKHAPSGQYGTQMARENPPDLILLDFEMPMMDGLETLKHLRSDARTARTPVVAITGSHRVSPRCAEMIAGCDAYLPKPFDMKTLRHTIATLLGL